MASTVSIEVGADWVEATAALNMADGTSYAVEFTSPSSSAFLEAVDSDQNNAPAGGAAGHRYYPGSPGRPGDYRTFPKVAGSFWWVRVHAGDGHLIATAID